MTEEWKSILGFEGFFYSVSNLGRVKSMRRPIVGVDGKSRIRRERIMSGSIKTNGYLHVSLRRTGEKQIKRHVHLLVATAFLPEKATSEEVNHLDCNKLNNAVTNLEWCSHAKNMAHAGSNGRLSRPGKSR